MNTSRTSKPKLAANLDKLCLHQSFLKAPEKISSRFSTPSQNLYTCFIKLCMCSHISNETSQEWPSEWHCHVISCPQTVSGELETKMKCNKQIVMMWFDFDGTKWKLLHNLIPLLLLTLKLHRNPFSVKTEPNATFQENLWSWHYQPEGFCKSEKFLERKKISSKFSTQLHINLANIEKIELNEKFLLDLTTFNWV